MLPRTPSLFLYLRYFFYQVVRADNHILHNLLSFHIKSRQTRFGYNEISYKIKNCSCLTDCGKTQIGQGIKKDHGCPISIRYHGLSISI